MTSGEPTETTPVLKITQDMYASLPTRDLILFAVQHLHAEGASATVEEIVSACFKLFPHRFSLKNYFYWPDSAHVVQALKYARKKKYIKETPEVGFILRPAGRQIARQAAKAMGVRLPMPPKPMVDDRPQSVEEKPKTVEEVKPAAPVQKKKQVVKKQALVNQKVVIKKTPKSGDRRQAADGTGAYPSGHESSLTPKAQAAKKKTVKTEAAPKPQKKAKKTPTKPVAKVTPKKVAPKPAAKKEQAAKQLPLLIPVAPKEEAKVTPVAKKRVKKQIQPTKKTKAVPVARKPAKKAKAKVLPVVKKQAPAREEAKPVGRKVKVEEKPIVSKEEKVKAGKVVTMVERSDAYRLYKKLGAKAKISEFDFRNMLFATMESSAETLKRNLDLFKRYAGIHNRADLIPFFEYCEGGFAPLLQLSAKKKR
jgi:hypothetical protein